VEDAHGWSILTREGRPLQHRVDELRLTCGREFEELASDDTRSAKLGEVAEQAWKIAPPTERRVGEHGDKAWEPYLAVTDPNAERGSFLTKDIFDGQRATIGSLNLPFITEP